MTRVNAGRSVVTGRRPSNIKVAEDGQFKGTQPEINFTGTVNVTNDESNNRVNVELTAPDLSGYQATSGKDATGGYVGLTLFKINFKNVLNTFTSFFTNSNTAARTYTFQNRDGTIADDTDLALKQTLVNAAVALVDGATMDLTAIKHTLTTSSATRTFTISYTGDDITIEITLNTTASVFTFPVGSLCVSEGIASGDNTCGLAGVSGDKYMIAIKKIGSVYYVVCKNFGQ